MHYFSIRCTSLAFTSTLCIVVGLSATNALAEDVPPSLEGAGPTPADDVAEHIGVLNEHVQRAISGQPIAQGSGGASGPTLVDGRVGTITLPSSIEGVTVQTITDGSGNLVLRTSVGSSLVSQKADSEVVTHAMSIFYDQDMAAASSAFGVRFTSNGRVFQALDSSAESEFSQRLRTGWANCQSQGSNGGAPRVPPQAPEYASRVTAVDARITPLRERIASLDNVVSVVNSSFVDVPVDYGMTPVHTACQALDQQEPSLQPLASVCQCAAAPASDTAARDVCLRSISKEALSVRVALQSVLETVVAEDLVQAELGRLAAAAAMSASMEGDQCRREVAAAIQTEVSKFTATVVNQNAFTIGAAAAVRPNGRDIDAMRLDVAWTRGGLVGALGGLGAYVNGDAHVSESAAAGESDQSAGESSQPDFDWSVGGGGTLQWRQPVVEGSTTFLMAGLVGAVGYCEACENNYSAQFGPLLALSPGDSLTVSLGLSFERGELTSSLEPRALVAVATAFGR